jgi:hypothetical protein
VQESPGLSPAANSVPMLSWLDTLEQSLLKAFGAKHFDELGCGTFVQNVNKVISGVVADGRSADTLPSVSATGPLGSDEVGGKCPSEDAWCQALEAAMATASEVGSVLEGLQQLEGLAHRHLGISSDMGTSLLSQSLKHQQAFALTSPHLTSPHLTSPHLTSPHLTSHCVALRCVAVYAVHPRVVSGAAQLPSGLRFCCDSAASYYSMSVVCIVAVRSETSLHRT